MSNKNKTVSFRVEEDKFEVLQDISDDFDISLSALFRGYTDLLVGLQESYEPGLPELMGESGSDSGPEDFLREYMKPLASAVEQGGDPEFYRDSVSNHMDLLLGNERYREFHCRIQEDKDQQFRMDVELAEDAFQESDYVDEEGEEFYEVFGDVLNCSQLGRYDEAREEIDEYFQSGKINKEQSTLLGGMVSGFEK